VRIGIVKLSKNPLLRKFNPCESSCRNIRYLYLKIRTPLVLHFIQVITVHTTPGTSRCRKQGRGKSESWWQSAPCPGWVASTIISMCLSESSNHIGFLCVKRCQNLVLFGLGYHEMIKGTAKLSSHLIEYIGRDV